MKEKIQIWAEKKTKEELAELAVILIRNGIDTEDIGFINFPYCKHSGDPLLDSDEWEED